MSVTKSIHNPIISIDDLTPTTDKFRILGVFNAGVTDFNGKTILLLRVAEAPVNDDSSKVKCPVFNSASSEIDILTFDRCDTSYDFSDPRVIKSHNGKNFLTSMSHIRLAQSDDGIHFDICDRPLISAFDCYTAYGVEDPRITKIDGIYYINFSAASDVGIITRLFSTTDFVNFTDLGNIFHPDNKDITIFPGKIGDLYYALHRPSTSEYGKPNIWIASSPDLVHWGNHRILAVVRDNMWDNGRIGASCVPFLTDNGWLELYHGATKENRYCLGAMLLDKEEPWRVLSRCEVPLLEPTESYELAGFFGNVVFSCGLLMRGDKLDIYYGASDDCVCVAHTTIGEVLELLGGN